MVLHCLSLEPMIFMLDIRDLHLNCHLHVDCIRCVRPGNIPTFAHTIHRPRPNSLSLLDTLASSHLLIGRSGITHLNVCRMKVHALSFCKIISHGFRGIALNASTHVALELPGR